MLGDDGLVFQASHGRAIGEVHSTFGVVIQCSGED